MGRRLLAIGVASAASVAALALAVSQPSSPELPATPRAARVERATAAAADPALPPRTVAWLDRMSRHAIGRGMDPAGTRYWATRLASGAPRVEATEDLVGTATWRRSRITEAYGRWLRTTPDPVSLDRWQRWLVDHPTSELDIRLAGSAEGRAAAGTTDAQRARSLAGALNLPTAAPHFAKQLAEGMPWGAVVRAGYLSHPASDRRMLDLAPRSAYTPDLPALVAEYRESGDERAPLARALATLA